MKTSFSALQTFSFCPLKYKFEQVDRIKAPKNQEAVFGSHIHNCLKYLHSPTPGYPDIENLLEHYSQTWPEPSQDWPEIEKQILFSQGARILNDYYGKNNPNDFTIADLEARFSLLIKDAKDQEHHLLNGIIDRIDKISEQDFEIIDYKTSKKLPAQKIVDESLQLSIYCLAVLNRWPKLEPANIKLSLYFLKHNTKLSCFRTPSQLQETKQEILGIIQQIKTSKFPPQPSRLCDWCAYQKYCPLFKHKFSQETPNKKKMAKMLAEFFALQAQIKQANKKIAQIKQAVNAYCAQNKIERVFSEQGYITRTKQQRYGYDLEKLRPILESLGKWEQVIKLDLAKLNKLLKELPANKKQAVQALRKIEKEFYMLSATKKR